MVHENIGYRIYVDIHGIYNVLDSRKIIYTMYVHIYPIYIMVQLPHIQQNAKSNLSQKTMSVLRQQA